MRNEEKRLTEQESLNLISSMLAQAKDSYRDTGTSAILWGCVISIASLVKVAEIHFDFRLPVDIYWLTLVAVIPQIYITLREKKNRRAKTYDEKYMDYIWLAFGICIFLLSMIINGVFRVWEPVAIDYRILTGDQSPFRFSEFVAPLFLLLYGLPTFITGAACKFRPMLIGGIICWVFCVVTIYTNLEIDLLLTALAAIIAWLIPGIIMNRQNRHAIRELAKNNV